MKIVSVSIFMSLILLTSCQSKDSKDNPSSFKSDPVSSSSHSILDKRSISQIVRLADKEKRFLLFFEGEIIEIAEISEAENRKKFLYRISTLENFNGAVSTDSQNFEESFWISAGPTGTSGALLSVGSVIIGVASTVQGLVTDIETNIDYSFYGMVVYPIDQDRDGNYMFKGGGITLRLVEEAKLNKSILMDMMKNVLSTQAAVHTDGCGDAYCENSCRTRDTDRGASVAPDCTEGQCFYGAGCVEVKLIDTPDFCEPCGDERERPSIISREIDGVLHCYDPVTFAEVECP